MSVSRSRHALHATLAALMLCSGPARAYGLMDAYRAALQNDPSYRAALYEREAGQEYQAIGKSYLLPNVSVNYSTYRNQADVTTDIQGVGNTDHRNYVSGSGAIQLRQPLFNLDSMARYRQGAAQTSASDAQFFASSQEFMVRLATLYVSANYAQDQLSLSIAQRDAYAEQMASNNRLYRRGEGTLTDMVETQTKFELAEAQVLESRDAVNNARSALAAATGEDIGQLDALRDDYTATPLAPVTFEEWKTIALAQNPEILAQRSGVEIARQEIQKASAGHAPRVDMLASVNRSNSDTPNTYRQRATVASLGVQLVVPIYSGGSVTALTRQAQASYEKAQANLDAKSNEVLVELQKQHSAMISGLARIDALIKSAASARLMIDATQKSALAGVRTNLDVLNAQRQLFDVRRELALARYNDLISYLRLRKAAGTLSGDDMEAVAGRFMAR